MPIHLKIKPQNLSPTVLLSGDPGRTKMVAEKFLTATKMINDFRGLLAYTGKYENVPVSVVTTGMGCPSAAIVIEELVNLGAKILIRIGTCGAVQKRIKPADLIIPNSAVPLVGLLKNYHLLTKITKPNNSITRKLTEKTIESGIIYWVGPICTSDAFYQEKKEAKEWEDKDILAMEMECAGLFALAKLRKVKAGAILTATGNILYGQQVMETKEIKKSISIMCKIALETIISFR
ncbi:MAG TPA: hypothetical protein DHV62_08410 [Elusimicrobia bacterium]|jgi:DeoD family purine-nucleoside phosphorylase|nr:hypothetical protein [Elusimicrobiota bacterium]